VDLNQSRPSGSRLREQEAHLVLSPTRSPRHDRLIRWSVLLLSLSCLALHLPRSAAAQQKAPAGSPSPLPTLLTAAAPLVSTTAPPADLFRTLAALAKPVAVPAPPAVEPVVAPRATDPEPAEEWVGEPSTAYFPLNDGGSEYGIEYQLARRASKTLENPVQQALSYLGTPYRRGGTTRNGIDCSGLIEAVYRQWGMEMPRTAAEQFREGKAIQQDGLQPGDLVFFRNTYKRGISHVGIYVGDGRFIHAAGKRKGVVVGELAKPYYQRRYIGARRLGEQPAPTPHPLQNAAALVVATALPAR